MPTSPVDPTPPCLTVVSPDGAGLEELAGPAEAAAGLLAAPLAGAEAPAAEAAAGLLAVPLAGAAAALGLAEPAALTGAAVAGAELAGAAAPPQPASNIPSPIHRTL